MLRAPEGGQLKYAIVLAIAALFALSMETRAQAPNIPAERQADAIFNAVTQKDAPGLAVLVRKNGRTLFEKGYGDCDLRTQAKIDTHTNFRLASFTKQFTAMAIMLLVHDGKLRYDQTLTEIFPDFPAYGKDITIWNLLNHTGGLPDYEDLMDAQEKVKGPVWSPEHQIQDDEVLALLKKETKGKFLSWNQLVVQQFRLRRSRSHRCQSFRRILRRFSSRAHFRTAPMDHTIVYQKGKNEVVNRAFGHSKEGEALKETDQSSTSATLGDGGIYSNLEDLAKWDDALRNHTLLNEKEMQPALHP